MSKDELLSKIDERIDFLFSSPAFYDDAKAHGIATTALRETVNLLVDEGVISEK